MERLLEAADVVLAVGCRFAHRSTQGLLLDLRFRPEQTLIHLDIDPAVIGKMFPATLGVVGDARDGLAALLAALGSGAATATRGRAKTVKESIPARAASAMKARGAILPSPRRCARRPRW